MIVIFILLFIYLQYDPTVEESYLTTIDIDGRALQVEILDTAGQKEYSPLRETFMHTGDGFLLIYSITDDQTLEELRDIREQISRVHPNHKVRGLAGGWSQLAASLNNNPTHSQQWLL